ERVRMEKDLQHPGVVSNHLPFGYVIISGDSCLVRNLRISQLTFRFADHRDFRNGVDAVGERILPRSYRFLKHMASRPAALLHRRGCERRETYAIAGGVDVRDFGLEISID